ncbi:SDR family oxidoreductase [Bacillus carboniphilus]|uniref:SDR family oxidoreductase n=1 Tax=Bacillus carboniphilus TaxID=86663 RepID=A0ABY9JUQ2_9BACI|nr:SDR family oxidoreductase [Bacillus carboniphilus]WLR42167.1 SDR family oxidoreductase [Bacillus carboniphilus]
MKKILVAGATGYLGRYLVKSFKEKGYYVRVLVRDEQKLSKQGSFLEPKVNEYVDEVFIGDVTKPESIKGVCHGMDMVCSSIGLTRQKGKQSFHEVDYLGNLHLLLEAKSAKVEKFMYIHVFGAEKVNNPLIQKKSSFVNRLKESTINYVIIKPTGYFSDISEILKMAQRGRVFLIGDGKKKIKSYSRC